MVNRWLLGLILVIVLFLHGNRPAFGQMATPDPSSMQGKVMVGYQGWFNCEGDGSDLGWAHWTKDLRKTLGPSNVSVDLWPDVSEYDNSELYDTDFRSSDGQVARVFSSADAGTVRTHFRWMQDYQIDGAFVQRFAVNLTHPSLLQNHNKVLTNVRHAAAESKRVFAVMYDLTGITSELFRRLKLTGHICSRSLLSPKTRFIYTTMVSHS